MAIEIICNEIRAEHAKKPIVALVALLVSCVAFATDYQVADTQKLVLTTGDIVEPASQILSQDALPDVATPIFRFDAKNPTGWEFDAIDQTKIVRIPSLVGSRFLSVNNDGGDFAGYVPNAPTFLSADPTLGGAPCVDFGDIGSQKALLFNAVGGINALSDIGTVFAVFNSEKGGGAFLGGGSGDNGGAENKGNCWLRGVASSVNNMWDVADPWSPVFRYYAGGTGNDVGDLRGVMGVVYHDGQATCPWRSGFSGGWEVITVQPTEVGLSAAGVGLGYARSGWASSGGQRIAELVIYGEKLTDADRAKVEAYLEKKWLNRDLRGWNGNATVDLVRASKNASESYLTNGATVEANVADGNALTINRLFGGRGGFATFTANGSGTLKVGDMGGYMGTVKLNGCKLDLTKKSIPSALPNGAVLRFDATEVDSLVSETDAEGLARVKRWTNLTDFTYNGSRLVLAPDPNASYADRTPWIRTGLAAGNVAIDFGPKASGGNYLVLCKAEAPATKVTLPNVMTVVAVVSPHSGATCMVGAFDGNGAHEQTSTCYFNASDYNRPWTAPLFFDKPLLSLNPSLTGAKDNTAFIDGIKRDQSAGYPHPGWQVVAFRGPGSAIASVGASGHHYYGGGAMALGEIVMYARPLSDDELRDASAYLSAKWFGRELPGYCKPTARANVPDVNQMEVTAASEINVAKGETVRIASLSVKAQLTKTGDGTLEVGTFVDEGAGIVLRGGKVKAASSSEPSSCDIPAVGPSAWFDASDESSFITVAANERDQGGMWDDRTGRNCAFMNRVSANNQPWINRTDTLNGRQVVDFGISGSWRFLKFGVPLDGIKAAFVVWGSQAGGGTLLGHYDGQDFANDGMDDFRRVTYPSKDDLILNESTLSQHVWGGKICLNGVETPFRETKPSGDWDLVEVYPAGAAHASAFAFSRGGEVTGGQRLAEVILYERELSENEKIATRNYLRKKWFGANAQELQPVPAATAIRVDKVIAESGETIAIEGEDDQAIDELQGTGTVVKNGAGTLDIALVDGFSGSLQVDGGTLRLCANAAPVRPADGLALWLDAGQNVVSGDFTDTNGRLFHDVAQTWTSAVGDGMQALTNCYHDAGMTPPLHVAEGGPNDKPYMKFKRGSYFRFGDASGKLVRFTDIGSVLWVIGSQEGGGCLLGDSTEQGGSVGAKTFRRETVNGSDNSNGFPGYHASDALLCQEAQAEVKAANWRVGGKVVDPTSDGLSGGWDIVSMRLKDGAAKSASADGLAYVGGRWQDQWLCGFQRLAEVLIYNRVLTDDEMSGAESYLAQKYGLPIGAVERRFENDLHLVLATGATLDCNGRMRYLASIEGAGAVRGDVTLGGLVADGSATEWMTVNGTVRIAAGATVELRNVADADGKGFVRILKAAAIEGNLGDVAFSGEVEGLAPQLRVRKGYLGVDLCRKGFILLMR